MWKWCSLPFVKQWEWCSLLLVSISHILSIAIEISIKIVLTVYILSFILSIWYVFPLFLCGKTILANLKSTIEWSILYSSFSSNRSDCFSLVGQYIVKIEMQFYKILLRIMFQMIVLEISSIFCQWWCSLPICLLHINIQLLEKVLYALSSIYQE